MRTLILFLFSLTLLTACGPTRQSEEPAVDPELAARQFMQTGDYIAAAEEYLALAEQDKNNAATYRLKATAAFVEAGNYDRAFSILKETSVPEDDALQSNRRRILSARLDLEFGRPEKAREQLLTLNPDNIPANMRATYHVILSRSYLAQQDYVKAANERLLAQPYLPGSRQQENYRSLWSIFQAIPESELESLRLSAPDELDSWFELASIYHSYRFDLEKLNYAIDSWSQRHPGHPAFSAVVPMLRDKSSQFVERPQKIGLLLPLSNQYKKASVAIRDGFLAAWYQDNNVDRSAVQVYDADSLTILSVYQQAVDDGVDYVIGPLEKEAVKTLMQSGNLPVPVLALNRLDNQAEGNSDKLIQFGLAPEDEAKQVAETAFSDGHMLALVVTPDNNWGQRLAESFIQRWNEIGGVVLEQVYFSSELKDFATPVKEVLNVDSSDARINEVRSTLNLKIQSRERRRQDVDFIFAAAVPADARQLLPQVRFFHADDVPVYSTSHIFSGVVDSTRDTDMNNVMFIDMPWILDTRHQLSLIQDSLNRNLSQDKSSYRRLYALGIDAYRLIPEINRLRLEKNTVLSGETGDLQLTDDNIIKRRLQRAQFVEGKPVLLN